MRKIIYPLTLTWVFFPFCIVKADSPAVPWSQVIRSSNGKYVLVLISPKVKEQEDYIFQSRELWRKGGIPAANVPEAEKDLRKEIDLETSIRKKYPQSGLYTEGKSPKLIWKIDLYDMRALIIVSNDGENVISFKDRISPIFEEKPLEYNPEVKEVTKVYPNMEEILLTFYSFGKPVRSYQASELLNPDEKFQRTTSSDFVWSENNALDERSKTFSVNKLGGKKIVFDFTTGNLIEGKLAARAENPVSKLNPANTNTRPFVWISIFIAALLLLFFTTARKFFY